MKVSGQSSGTRIELDSNDVKAWRNAFHSLVLENEGVRITIDAEGNVNLNGSNPLKRQAILDAMTVARVQGKASDDGALADAILQALDAS